MEPRYTDGKGIYRSEKMDGQVGGRNRGRTGPRMSGYRLQEQAREEREWMQKKVDTEKGTQRLSGQNASLAARFAGRVES